MRLSDAVIKPYKELKGDFEKAARLISDKSNIWTNAEIAEKSGVNVNQIKLLRRRIRIGSANGSD